ncbi:putative amidase-like protein [Aneurinibacillus soli]|uniref:Putative amidase domain protein n=2 Tax=Aneurinibacillus soli TaxID=1500254 RepID=A0A0U4WL38_9BACL|nr:putative amidase-like protein [Aneurinibacillus soli]BAU29163.1 putative amidase domain protein [Aneurinibacillus soli]
MKKIIVNCLCVFLLVVPRPVHATESDTEAEIHAFLNKLFEVRTQLLIENNSRMIEKYYNPKQKTSLYALQHENRRANYIQKWAEKRGVAFVEANSSITITRTKIQGNMATISLLHTLKLTYIYPGKSIRPQSFGTGTRHGIRLEKTQAGWHVAREWYSDPIEENPATIPSHSMKDMSHNQAFVLNAVDQSESVTRMKKYNRNKAVEYANKYAGAAWGAGNDHRYNPKYRDYHHEGGDCTNFASQVLGDQEEGGGLPMRSGWYYRYKQGGSTPWVRTDSFKNFLIRSGYGKVIARGSYADVIKPTIRNREGAMARLQPGDLIGYEMHGDIDHFSIVVGRDENGYVLVNSHTGDRYRVPWDLGWDKYTKFVLIHIRD